ncbi:DUF2846 domain-containing protein [Gillisia sp. M10.2A]|uniref:DUF2846 domain-containing protein n=1 Tax=Gillisia lutea TaxID=2909668 RepID=A0ABS9EG56_9FLAO|nr:DUF2846 domain-containing protein [Gillisia lutea]MCF4101873.1 DUF2846 domain-containing protein [Gillisia lutea]
MSKLVIKKRSEWMNKMCKIELHLDGSKIGSIENGETREFEIEPGNHKIIGR